MVLQLCVLIDSGGHEAITAGETKEHIRAGNVMDWLKTLDPKLKTGFEMFDTHGIYPLEAREWQEGLERQLNAYIMKDDFGIEKRGLCMLLVLTAEQLKSEVERVVDAARKKTAEAEEPPVKSRKH